MVFNVITKGTKGQSNNQCRYILNASEHRKISKSKSNYLEIYFNSMVRTQFGKVKILNVVS